MRSFATRIVILLAALLMTIGFSSIPSASAQGAYTPVVPPTTESGGTPDAQAILDANLIREARNAIEAGAILIVGVDGSLTLQGGSTNRIEIPANLVAQIRNLLLQLNPVLYDGPVGAGGIIDFEIPDGFSGQQTLTLTVTLKDGSTIVKDYSVTIAATARSAVNLAFTGSGIQLPVAIGASLVGAGGLALVVARKRSYKL
jgi:hypothetical protein